ncbi:hypothetical protein [Curtobacterium sp. MCSS17_016]|uniref:hypothetical protein n=1 Tax=Curtobacterium sp. MCSS17_016 TaxID=2175644 RepID=UPI000DA80974|nr:hypothetical protein [Curtobacterium sp. MCSS17_016]WIE81042.1 hypothetical protein DEJ19_021230 [Curtobacterium sp. MCSS17_016]
MADASANLDPQPWTWGWTRSPVLTWTEKHGWPRFNPEEQYEQDPAEYGLHPFWEYFNAPYNGEALRDGDTKTEWFVKHPEHNTWVPVPHEQVAMQFRQRWARQHPSDPYLPLATRTTRIETYGEDTA